MNKDLEIICSKIVDYSNALSSLFLEDYKKLINDEFADLSTKQQVILELLRVKTRTVNEISHFLSITASAASQLISKLEKQDYVKREINPDNRREIIVQLGEKGHHYNEMIAKNQLFIIEKYYAQLPKDDLEKLLDIHEKLYHIAVKAQKE
ncbi:MarR family winged helix-turn-helix transcriptional regulator [Neobacillus niacini]|uniref:MarR family winged helix-turn-helix transcriptional regulator n=1 Tax=Neobacillus niacini TaxID=86668 RepID=UPI00052F4F37|nr:MarR family winged helix-turn-helix transcriptional regulator [Neobacillus niacini]KGM46295.1 MarR family transcriptional regulator [Neobacillus niacini]MEC1524418.1 MarR family winged helix-turn-helix transcriptional regulator [Neobacillus niacini]